MAAPPERNHDADGLSARRPSSTTIEIDAPNIAGKAPQAAKLAQPHVDPQVAMPLAHFADAATKAINAQQEKDVGQGGQ